MNPDSVATLRLRVLFYPDWFAPTVAISVYSTPNRKTIAPTVHSLHLSPPTYRTTSNILAPTRRVPACLIFETLIFRRGARPNRFPTPESNPQSSTLPHRTSQRQMPPPALAHDLTPAEIAALIGPDNHPHPLSAAELESLMAPLTDEQLEEVLNLLGLDSLARQFPPALLKLMRVAKHVASARPPEYDDEIDTITRNFDLVGFASVGPIYANTAAAGRSYIVNSPAKAGRTISWLEAGALTQGIRGASVHGTGSRRRGRKKSGAYVVFYGGTIAVFDSWDQVQPAITGHGVAIHSGFPSIPAAHAALEYARSKGWTGDSTPPPASPSPSTTYAENPLNAGSEGLWYVVCRGVQPGVYRSHLECSLNITGVKGNLFASFETLEEAETAFRRRCQVQLGAEDFSREAAVDRVNNCLPPRFDVVL
ncbi:hypothetical protein C8R47DRAFT_1231422 [Mycena vitilis]|nr:hypothetical protein C8R47DRAFT_1231422 [Mycena vitilis]